MLANTAKPSLFSIGVQIDQHPTAICKAERVRLPWRGWVHNKEGMNEVKSLASSTNVGIFKDMAQIASIHIRTHKSTPPPSPLLTLSKHHLPGYRVTWADFFIVLREKNQQSSPNTGVSVVRQGPCFRQEGARAIHNLPL